MIKYNRSKLQIILFETNFFLINKIIKVSIKSKINLRQPVKIANFNLLLFLNLTLVLIANKPFSQITDFRLKISVINGLNLFDEIKESYWILSERT